MTDRTAGMRGYGILIVGLAIAGCNSPVATPNTPPVGPNGPGFSIAFEDGNTRTVVPGEVLQLNLLIEREEGFEGAIELSSSDAPGIVVIFRPEIVLHREDRDLLVVAAQASQRKTHQIEFTGRSEGHPPKTTTLELTVVDSK